MKQKIKPAVFQLYMLYYYRHFKLTLKCLLLSLTSANMQEQLQHYDFSKFPSLKVKLIESVDRMLSTKISSLIEHDPRGRKQTASSDGNGRSLCGLVRWAVWPRLWRGYQCRGWYRGLDRESRQASLRWNLLHTDAFQWESNWASMPRRRWWILICPALYWERSGSWPIVIRMACWMMKNLLWLSILLKSNWRDLSFLQSYQIT